MLNTLAQQHCSGQEIWFSCRPAVAMPTAKKHFHANLLSSKPAVANPTAQKHCSRIECLPSSSVLLCTQADNLRQFIFICICACLASDRPAVVQAQGSAALFRAECLPAPTTFCGIIGLKIKQVLTRTYCQSFGQTHQYAAVVGSGNAYR